jgi:hypothetical protein
MHMAVSCSNPDCTVAATGKCLLLHEDPRSCPQFLHLAKATARGDPESATNDLGDIGRQFHAGNELGIEEAAELMRMRYTSIIGILGQYDVGKTCFLSSLYLLAACGGLGPQLRFAGSLTLSGFEARARRLRQWKDGALPHQLVDHTSLSDPRVPALLHLALQEVAGMHRRFELLLTDLPGEWSKALIADVGNAERFRFLSRADGIVLVLDGPKLRSELRHQEVHSAELLLSRVADTIRIDRAIPLVIMVSKADELQLDVPADVAKVDRCACDLGFSPIVVPVAAISRKPDEVKSGTGVLDVIEHILRRSAPPASVNAIEAIPTGKRAFERIRTFEYAEQ